MTSWLDDDDDDSSDQGQEMPPQSQQQQRQQQQPDRQQLQQQERVDSSSFGGVTQYLNANNANNNANNNNANTAETAAVAAQAASTTCWGRFQAELNCCQPQFVVRDRATGRDFDIPESFAPTGWKPALYKFVVLALALFTMIYEWIDQPANFYLAYLTSWGVFFISLYFLASAWNSIWQQRTPQPPETVGCRIRITWILAELASHISLVIVICYWYLVHDYDNGLDGYTYYTLMAHGILAILTWIDVLYVNRIPFRWMHYWTYVLPIESLWVIWSVLHAYVGDLGNPERDGSSGDPDTNDDLIYDFLDWQNDWQESLILTIIVLLGLGPICYLVLWLTSIYKWPCCCRQDRRKYTDTVKEDDPRPTVDDVEEGSIFAKWW